MPKVSFHDLRHGFATNALTHGIDGNTPSTILSHTSGNTALNIYAHVTDAMRRTAAKKIDRRTAKAGGEISPETARYPNKTGNIRGK